MTWEEKAAKTTEKPKWLAKGTKVFIDPKTAPESTTIMGKFGPRTAYILRTTDYGRIYVSEQTFMHVITMLNGNYTDTCTVEV